MKKIAYYHQCGGCNQITNITSLNPWLKYFVIPQVLCNGEKYYTQIMSIVWLYENNADTLPEIIKL